MSSKNRTPDKLFRMLRLLMKMMGESEERSRKKQIFSILNISNATRPIETGRTGGRSPFNLGICVHSSKFYTTTFMCNAYGRDVSLFEVRVYASRHYTKFEFIRNFEWEDFAIHNTNKQWIKMPALSCSLKTKEQRKKQWHVDIWNTQYD